MSGRWTSVDALEQAARSRARSGRGAAIGRWGALVGAAIAPVEMADHVQFPAADTWDQEVSLQRDYFARIRGFDKIRDDKGALRLIPRTSVSDARQLVTYWEDAIKRSSPSSLPIPGAMLPFFFEHSFADVSWKHPVEQWTQAASTVRSSTLADAAVYPDNTRLWNAIFGIAIQLATTAEAPSRWTLIKQSVERTIDDTRKKIEGGTPWFYLGAGAIGAALIYGALRR